MAINIVQRGQSLHEKWEDLVALMHPVGNSGMQLELEGFLSDSRKS